MWNRQCMGHTQLLHTFPGDFGHILLFDLHIELLGQGLSCSWLYLPNVHNDDKEEVPETAEALQSLRGWVWLWMRWESDIDCLGAARDYGIKKGKFLLLDKFWGFKAGQVHKSCLPRTKRKQWFIKRLRFRLAWTIVNTFPRRQTFNSHWARFTESFLSDLTDGSSMEYES